MLEQIPTDHTGLEQYAKAVLEREAEAKQMLAIHKETWGEGAPYFSVATFAFWRELAKGRFHLARCANCNHIYFPPRVVCPECWAQDVVELHPTPGFGTLVTFTDLHVTSQVLKPIAPVRMAVVDLDEGVRVLTWLRGKDAAQADPGTRCLIVVEELLGRKWFVANLSA